MYKNLNWPDIFQFVWFFKREIYKEVDTANGAMRAWRAKKGWISSIISIISKDESNGKGVRKSRKEYNNMDHMNKIF